MFTCKEINRDKLKIQAFLMETGEDTSGASGHGNSMELERHWKTEKLREWERERERGGWKSAIWMEDGEVVLKMKRVWWALYTSLLASYAVLFRVVAGHLDSLVSIDLPGSFRTRDFSTVHIVLMKNRKAEVNPILAYYKFWKTIRWGNVTLQIYVLSLFLLLFIICYLFKMIFL